MLKQKTVYFREEDLPLWANVQNKAQFLHDALATGLSTIPPRNTNVKEVTDTNAEQHIKASLVKKGMDSSVVASLSLRKSQKFCKNGHPIPESRNKCLGKSCRYS